MSKSLDYLALGLGGAAIVLAVAFALPTRSYKANELARAEARAEAAEAEIAERSAAFDTERAAFEEQLALASAASGDPAPEGAGFGLGRPALPEEIAAWDIDVRPDGMGLPEGSGDVATGEEIWIDKCATCHGDFGEAVGRWPVIAGGEGTLTSDDPNKTVGSYWPYASTAWDYVHRAMPFGEAQSLSDDEVYALVAYILYSNYIVEDDFTLSRETFADVVMPNVDGFYMDDRAEAEIPAFSGEVCMENCKDSVEITARAMVLDVTPEEDGTPDTGTAAEIEPTEAADEEPVAAPEEEAPAEAAPAVEETAALDPALVAEGESLFRRCSSCHQVGDGAVSRTGPHLNGVLGRQAGGLEDFRYSNQMVAAGAEGLSWTDDTLTAFLMDPRGYIQGTRMSFNGLRGEDEAAAIIAYLRSTGD